jgi:hypothetical protein
VSSSTPTTQVSTWESDKSGTERRTCAATMLFLDWLVRRGQARSRHETVNGVDRRTRWLRRRSVLSDGIANIAPFSETQGAFVHSKLCGVNLQYRPRSLNRRCAIATGAHWLWWAHLLLAGCGCARREKEASKQSGSEGPHSVVLRFVQDTLPVFLVEGF